MGKYTLIIGSKNYSSWSLRGWLAMRQTGAAFEEVLIPFHGEDRSALIRARSPSGLVPVLIDDGLLIHDSLAIAEYLAERHPEAGLWPGDARARAVARSVSAEMHSGFTALRANMPMNFRRRRDRPTATPETNAAIDADIMRITTIWRDCRARFGAGGPFLFGAFSAADAMYAPVVSRLRTYGVEVDPDSRAYMDAVWSHPPMTDWGGAAEGEPPIPKYDDI